MTFYNHRALCFTILALCCLNSAAQEKGRLHLTYFFGVGLSGQFDFLDQFREPYGYNGIYSNIHGNGGNDEGIGIPLVIQAYSEKLRFGITYEPVLRYDVTSPGSVIFIPGQGYSPEENGLFADHHFSIIHKFSFTKRLPRFLRLNNSDKNYLGIGYSMMSPGLSYKYDWYIYHYNSGKEERGTSVDIAFNGFHFLVGFPAYRRFFFEGKLLWVPPGQRMFENYQYNTMLVLKGYYQIPIKFSR